jgi:hypothetical protein
VKSSLCEEAREDFAILLFCSTSGKAWALRRAFPLAVFGARRAEHTTRAVGKPLIARKLSLLLTTEIIQAEISSQSNANPAIMSNEVPEFKNEDVKEKLEGTFSSYRPTYTIKHRLTMSQRKSSRLTWYIRLGNFAFVCAN